MARHSYHPMCGCAQCCETERAMELDDEMRDQYQDDLVECPSFIAELALENKEAESIATAMRSDSLRGVGLAIVHALYRAADELIDTHADKSGITPSEAAKHLYEVYRSQTRNEPTPRLAEIPVNRRVKLNSEHVEVLREIEARFVSGNSIPVERVHITRAEFDAIASLTAPAEAQPVGDEEVEYEFEVWQDESMQAFGSASDYATAKSEADHYALMYGQDGPVEVHMYVRRQITTTPSTPVGVERILAEMREEGQADIVDGGVVLEWEDDLRNALAQQPPAEAQAQGGGEFGVGIQPNPKARYWQDRAEFWRTQAVALGWREKRDAANGEAPPPSAPVGVADADLVTRLDAIHQRVFGKPYPTEALAQQPAAPDISSGHYGDSSGHMQPAAVDDEMVDEALRSWFECDDWPSLLAGIEGVDRCRSRMLRALTAALATQPAATLPDEDDSDLTVAYMAGLHDGRKEAQQPEPVEVDELAQVIREVDGKHSLGAGALAEAILEKFPTIAQHPAACTRCGGDGEVASTDPYAETEPCPECKPNRQPAAVDEAMVERIAALLHEEATDEPWTVAGVEHDGPDRDYYRTLARKVIVRAYAALAQQPAAVQKGYKNGLDAALRTIADIGIADSEAQTNGREDAYRAVEALAAQQGGA